MPDEDEVTPVSRGWKRRDVMIKGAVAGGILWAAPVVESFTSRAYASTAGSLAGFPCSYATIIFTDPSLGSGSFAIKINDPNPGCNLTNTDGSYKGQNLGPVCNGVQYAVDANNELMIANGADIPAATGSACSLFSINGCTITATGANTVIQFVLVHDGSINNGTLVNGTTFCAPSGNSFTISGATLNGGNTACARCP
jgi:hypothetical protein